MNKNSEIEIFRAEDKNKDQSYFLFGLPQPVLNLLRTPLGNYTKPEVRAIAEKHGLVRVSKKPDSQELCFLGDQKPQEFIEKNYNQKFTSGKVIDIDTGKEIGEHIGIANYTVGQRKGFGISSPEKKYVVKIDPQTNTVFFGHDTHLYQKSLKVSWIRNPPYEGKAFVKIRYRHDPCPAKIFEDGTIEFQDPQRAITLGQAAVAYDENDRLIAGGFITQ